MPPDRPGFELPLLLAGAFRAIVDALHAELARQGHPHARPIHGFALQALGAEGQTISALARRLGVTKQAAAKTVAGLERLGYVRRVRDPVDGRAVRVLCTPRGEELLTLSALAFERLRLEWVDAIGAARLSRLEDDLERLVKPAGIKLGDLPGWLR